MVYEQEGKRWIFFHDLFGRWQWSLVDRTGKTVEQAQRSFLSCCACMKDARTRGFTVARSRSTRLGVSPVAAYPATSAALQPSDEA
jgi:hypothetical protein